MEQVSIWTRVQIHVVDRSHVYLRHAATWLISVECWTFKPFNLHMLIHWHCYLFDFVLFYCFRVLNKDAINFINFGLKEYFEKAKKICLILTNHNRRLL
jgi:hypothetical protein